MMFYEINLVLCLISFVLVHSSSREIMDDIFYGDTLINKNTEFNKLKEQLEFSNNQIIPIKSMQTYLLYNFTNFKAFDKMIANKGNCSYFLSIKNSFSRFSNFTENIKNLKGSLNDKNYIFNDKEGNMIVYSTCSNFIDISCSPQFYFISKL